MTQSLRHYQLKAIAQRLGVALFAGSALVILISSTVSAMRFSSGNYTIDAATLNNVGGLSESSNYQLTSSGGEAAIGNGASGSYKLAAGYAAQVITPAITVKTQPSGLTGYYPLDENSGTITHDTSTNTYLGSFVGTPTWAVGKLGAALTFNGTNQALTFNDASQAQLTSGTIEAWVKTSTSTGTQTLIAKYGSWLLGISNGRPMLYNFSNSTTCTSTTSIADGNWHAITATLQSGVTNGSLLYIDGVQSQACTWSPQNQTGIVTVAAQYNGSAYSQYFPGTLDQIKLFNRALGAGEVLAEYTAQNAGTETGLTLQTVVPGVSNTSSFNVITLTSGSSYTLAVHQNNNLQSGANTIPAISGSIASPVSWSEGTTKGLGFTLTSTNATAIPGKWSSGNAYAALPNTSTAFYTRTGLQSGGVKDTLGIQLRLDTATDQAGGSYVNAMYITGTANP